MTFTMNPYSWILDLADKWTKSDSKIACELTYPILSKIWAIGSAYHIDRDVVRSRLNTVLKSHLNELIQFETYCGYSLLEFEQMVYKDRPLVLYARLMGREYLPVNQVTGNLFWSLSELMLSKGHRPEAETIWEKLKNSGEDSVKEVRFARSRLDKRKTELEDLWE